MSSYTYTISTDCPNGQVNTDKLNAELLAASFAAKFSYLSTSGDGLEIFFSSALDTAEETELNTLVTTDHDSTATVASLGTTLEVHVIEQGDLNFTPLVPTRTISEAGYSFGGIQVALDWAYLQQDNFDSIVIKVGAGTFEENLTWNKNYSKISIEGVAPPSEPYTWALTLNKTAMQGLVTAVQGRYTSVLKGTILGSDGSLKYWRNILIDNTVSPTSYSQVAWELVNFKLLESSDVIILKGDTGSYYNAGLLAKNSTIYLRHIITWGVYSLSLLNSVGYGIEGQSVNPVMVMAGLVQDLGWGTPVPNFLLSDGSSAALGLRTFRLYNSGFYIANKASLFLQGLTQEATDNPWAWQNEADKASYASGWYPYFIEIENHGFFTCNVGDTLTVDNYYRTIICKNATVNFNQKLNLTTGGYCDFKAKASGSFKRKVTQGFTGNLIVATNVSDVTMTEVDYTVTSGDVEFTAINNSTITFDLKPEKPDGSSLKVKFSPGYNSNGKNSNSFVGDS